MPPPGIRRAAWAVWAAALFAVPALAAERGEHEEGEGYEGRRFTAPAADSAYVVECGACHVAFPVQLLGTADWAKVLGALDRHYGTDASLDAAALKEVARQLGVATVTRAARGAAVALPRITTSAWFRDEHREVAGAAWSSPKVKKASNCEACHTDAASFQYQERSIRIPK
jgi:hypothetical protein